MKSIKALGLIFFKGPFWGAYNYIEEICISKLIGLTSSLEGNLSQQYARRFYWNSLWGCRSHNRKLLCWKFNTLFKGQVMSIIRYVTLFTQKKMNCDKKSRLVANVLESRVLQHDEQLPLCWLVQNLPFLMSHFCQWKSSFKIFHLVLARHNQWCLLSGVTDSHFHQYRHLCHISCMSTSPFPC